MAGSAIPLLGVIRAAEPWSAGSVLGALGLCAVGVGLLVYWLSVTLRR